MRNRDLHRLNAHIGKHFNGVVDGLAVAGDDRLRGAVFVGHGHVTADARKLRLHLFGRRGDRGHFAIVFHLNVGHGFGTGANGFEAVFKIKNARSHRSGVFAQAVAHDHIGFQTKRREQAHHGHIGGQDGRLGHFGLFDSGFTFGQLFFVFARFAPERIGQVLPDQAHQNAVGLHKGIHDHFVLRGQIFHHVHILGSLAREHETNFGFDLTGRKRIDAFHL